MGGAENFFIRMVEALTDAGHETFAVSRGNGPIAKLLSPKVKQLHLPLASKWDYWSRWKLKRLIAQHRPEVVQTYMSRASRLTRLPKKSSSVLIARLGGYYTIRGNYDHAEAWVGNTRDICDYLVKQGLPADRIFHIGNFVPHPREVDENELSQLRSALQIPNNALIIFALGRMIEKKGFQDLLQAFAGLPAIIDGKPLILLLAGDGTERARYEQLAQNLNIRERVKFAGWQTDTIPYFKLADLFVCPSRHEPLGNIILEAWMNGKPVLSTRNEGAQELITPDKNALIVPVGDSQGLRDGLQRLVSLSAVEKQNLIDEGYKAAANHSEDAVVNAYVNLYQTLCQQKKDRAGLRPAP
ncbi:MAG: glycosyltransferase [Burkholderiaceae bacterium]